MPLNAAPMFGTPAANGNSNGFFGSKLPIDRLFSNDEGFIAPSPAAAEASDENGRFDASDVGREDELMDAA